MTEPADGGLRAALEELRDDWRSQPADPDSVGITIMRHCGAQLAGALAAHPAESAPVADEANPHGKTEQEIERSNRWFAVALAMGKQDDFVEMLATERRSPAPVADRERVTDELVAAGVFRSEAASKGCTTCNGWNPVSGVRTRETVGMVCPDCGHDYARSEAVALDREAAVEATTIAYYDADPLLSWSTTGKFERAAALTQTRAILAAARSLARPVAVALDREAAGRALGLKLAAIEAQDYSTIADAGDDTPVALPEIVDVVLKLARPVAEVKAEALAAAVHEIEARRLKGAELTDLERGYNDGIEAAADLLREFADEMRQR